MFLTSIIIRKIPTIPKPVYCSRSGLFFTFNKERLRKILPNKTKWTAYGRKFPSGSRAGVRHPQLRDFGSKPCHIAMLETWVGPRPEGYEGDHINGDIENWRLSNLEWVTRAENIRRATIMRAMRPVGDNPAKRKPFQMKAIYRRFTCGKALKSSLQHYNNTTIIQSSLQQYNNNHYNNNQ